MNPKSAGSARKSPVSYDATVVSNTRITPESASEEVRELVLDIDRIDFPFQIGQSIGVLAPGDEELGEEYHFRMYSLADVPARNEEGQPRITICVRRCVSKDSRTGSEYKGIASNYLCDRSGGDTISITGPVGIPFEVPEAKDANMVLIGTGTGIAPFRAFVKHLYRDVSDWTGRVWLFYGASSGLETLYMNDHDNDLARYVDEQTFEAFQALSPKPNWADPLAWDQAFSERGGELYGMFSDPKTFVYVAGLEKMSKGLDAVFSTLAGSEETWQRQKSAMIADKRWIEVLY